MKLAAQLGCTVREAQARVDSPEFTEWRGWWALNPSIENRLDLLIAAVSGHLPDFFAKYRELEAPPSDDQTADEVHGFFSRLAQLYETPQP